MNDKVDGLVRRWFGHLAFKHLLAAAFGLILLVTTLMTALWLSRSGDQLVDNMMSRLATETQHEVQRDLDTYIDIPDRIIAYIAQAIRSGRIDIDDREAMAALIHSTPWRVYQGSLFDVFIGRPNGEFLGLVKGIPGKLDARNFFLYGRPGLNDGRLVGVPANPAGSMQGESYLAERYDPRQRPWYRPAVESSGRLVWTELYASSGAGEATVTRSRAIYDDDGELIGVIGVDLFFQALDLLLANHPVGDKGEIFVYNESAKLLAAYAPDRPDVSISPLNPHERRDKVDDRLHFSRASSDYVYKYYGHPGELSAPVHEQVTLNAERGFLFYAPLGHDKGLHWSFGVFLPRSDYHSPSLLRLMPLPLLITVLIWLSMTGFIHLILKPLRELSQAADQIATGDFDADIETRCTNEIGQLARSIDGMRIGLKDSFDTLSRQKQRAETTLSAIADGVITADINGRIEFMNAAAARLTGVSSENAIGQLVGSVFRTVESPGGLPLSTEALMDLRHAHHRIAREITLLGPYGLQSPIHCRVSMVEQPDAPQGQIVIVFQDLSEERRLESELLHHATHDALTDLINRREFKRRLGVAIEGARRRDLTHVVCVIDLDQFKVLNDSCGHAAGDELLRQIAQLLEEVLRSGDTIARLGGDEFGVLLENSSLEHAKRMMLKLHDHLASFRFRWQEKSFSIGISAGLALIDQTTLSASQIMRDADGACYMAKEDGRNQIHVYQENEEKLSQRRGELHWLEVIEHALDTDGFQLYVQPIRRSRSSGRQLQHFEVLLRLVGIDGEIISPGRFLPAAERYGMATPIDRWVVTHMLEWLTDRPELAADIGLCSINLSGQSLGNPSFQEFLLDAIDSSEASPEKLCFEITETASIANLSLATQLIGNLRARGCRLALDDFGSGLSSFAYLKSLPVDYLKIDGMFVRDICSNPLDLAMVRSINEVGHTMGMETIAEFVETPAVAELLSGLKVDFLQGVSIGVPMPIDELFSSSKPEPVRQLLVS